MFRRVAGNEWWMGGIATVWSGALLLVDVPVAAWFGIGWGAVVLLHRAHPILAVLGATILWCAGALVGVPETNAAALLPMLIVYFGAGRYLASALSCLLIIVGLLPLSVGSWHAQVPDYLFAALLYAAVWGAGRALRHRAQLTAQAWALTRSLAKNQSVASPSGVRVLDSLGALSDSFFADVTSAVGKIRELARQAQIDLVPQRIEEILTIGAATVAKLKELIISLRAIPGLSMDSPQPVRIKHRTWLIWVGYSVLVVALGLDAVFAPGGFNVVAFILSILMFVLCLVSRSRPTIAGWGLACLFAVTFLPMIPLPEGLGPAAIDCIIAWRLARGKFRELAALLGMLTILIIALGLNAPWNMPINLGTLALVIFASRTWKEHELDELAALRTAEELRAEFSQVLNANLAREGLALAQLIHDATSHSVGVLLIQANAALALIDKDPVASRKALALVYSVGATAQEELQRLASERDQHTRAYQLANLERLMTQLIDTGISVSVNQQIAPGCSVAPYLYRVAAEALFNAARHAPGSGVSVVFHASVLHCGVEVSNGPATIATSPTPGSGEGLTGLALELAALGGTLRYGSTPQGGFALSAWIPVTLHHGSVATIVNPTIKKHSLREET